MVQPEHRDAFHQGQAAWQETARLQGHGGQLGGWSNMDACRAVILGLWQDEAAHREFMSQDHDRIFQQSGQADHIHRLETELWHRIPDLEGPCPVLPSKIAEANCVRLVAVQLLPGQTRRDHFLATQPKLWAPAMHAAGCLGFGVSEDPDDSLRFLLLSLWNDEDQHRNWREDGFRETWYAADVEGDCESITGDIIPVIPTWRVH